MRFLVIEILGCVVWRPESTMRLKKPWSGWFNYPKHPKTTNFTMLHPSPKTLPRREPPVEPSVDATADLTEMEHFGNLWHRGRWGWLQLIWWCSMVFIFFKKSTWSTWNQSRSVRNSEWWFQCVYSCDCRCVGLRQNPQPCAEPFPHGHHELVAQELDSAGTIARRLILCGTSMNIL